MFSVSFPVGEKVSFMHVMGGGLKCRRIGALESKVKLKLTR